MVLLKDLWADYHPDARRDGTMAQGRAESRYGGGYHGAPERPSTPRSRADDLSRVKGGMRKVGSGLLPALFQEKKE